LGITTRLLADHDRATGRFQVVVRGEDDRLVGVVDPRGSGVAAGLS
jgi:gamma-glutamyltranspeptidase